MKLIYVNDKNAKHFKKEASEKSAFVKYFSPSCPACIAMEDEWTAMCDDIDKKYNTDMILAQMDSSGMKELDGSDIYTDVDYVPTLVVLKNGKKHKEYNGNKTKDEMIEFLKDEGLITSKMKGGKKRRSKKGGLPPQLLRSRQTKSKSKSRPDKSKYLGEKQYKADFNFTSNKSWLEPFLIEVVRGENIKNPSMNDAKVYATRVVDRIFRNNSAFKTFRYDEYSNTWLYCADKVTATSECRKSPGFKNKMIPVERKFNPEFASNEKAIGDAENAYNFLANFNSIEEVLKTPSSDYTGRYLKQDNGLVSGDYLLSELREKQKIESNNILAILDVYGYKAPVTLKDAKEASILTRDVQNEVLETVNKMTADPKFPSLKGGKSRKRKSKSCKGKRNGKKGCRTCCKKKRSRKRCIRNCMRN
jgi:thiol-disulfide isomerase/thioredoxin